MSGSTCAVQGTIATSMAIMKTQSWIQAQRDPHHKLGVNWERSNCSRSQSASDAKIPFVAHTFFRLSLRRGWG